MQKKETPSLSLVVPSPRSEEHTSELQSHLISYAVFCLKKKKKTLNNTNTNVENSFTPHHRDVALTHTRTVTPKQTHKHMHAHYNTHCTAFFFFNDTATTEIYTLSLHDALPI